MLHAISNHLIIFTSTSCNPQGRLLQSFVLIFICYMKGDNHICIISPWSTYIHGKLHFKFTYLLGLWEVKFNLGLISSMVEHHFSFRFGRQHVDSTVIKDFVTPANSILDAHQACDTCFYFSGCTLDSEIFTASPKAQDRVSLRLLNLCLISRNCLTWLLTNFILFLRIWTLGYFTHLFVYLFVCLTFHLFLLILICSRKSISCF